MKLRKQRCFLKILFLARVKRLVNLKYADFALYLELKMSFDQRFPMQMSHRHNYYESEQVKSIEKYLGGLSLHFLRNLDVMFKEGVPI